MRKRKGMGWRAFGKHSDITKSNLTLSLKLQLTYLASLKNLALSSLYRKQEQHKEEEREKMLHITF